MDRYSHIYADVENSKFPVSPSCREQFLTVLHDLLGPANLTRPKRSAAGASSTARTSG
jgi:hypothetical protein